MVEMAVAASAAVVVMLVALIVAMSVTGWGHFHLNYSGVLLTYLAIMLNF
jgi:hypothetical protein